MAEGLRPARRASSPIFMCSSPFSLDHYFAVGSVEIPVCDRQASAASARSVGGKRNNIRDTRNSTKRTRLKTRHYEASLLRSLDLKLTLSFTIRGWDLANPELEERHE